MDYKDIKKQIRDQTREKLPQVQVPQSAGYAFKEKTKRDTVTPTVLRFNKRYFALVRGGQFRLTREGFRAFGGEYAKATINSDIEGTLRDNGIIAGTNIEYSIKFAPNVNKIVSLPVSVSANSSVAIYVARGNQSVDDTPSFEITGDGFISLSLAAGVPITVFLYYYTSADNGYIEAFTGLGEYVASWMHIDIDPPQKPEWYSIPLVTEAADPGAGTTKVTLQFLAPVTAPGSEFGLKDGQNVSGILIDQDLAGHNIYRVANTTIGSGGVRSDPDDGANVMIYEGNQLQYFVPGGEVATSGTVEFLAQYNNSTDDDNGASATISGTPRYRKSSKLGVYDDTELLTNPSFTGTYGYTPTGWSVASTGVLHYTKERGDLATYLVGSGTLYQDITVTPSRKYVFSATVENHGGDTTVVKVLSGDNIIASSVVGGVREKSTVRVSFYGPLSSGARVAVEKTGSGYCYVHQASVKQTDYYRSVECASVTTNTVVNGSMETWDGGTPSGWTSVGSPTITGSAADVRFGYITPLIVADSGGGIKQDDLFVNTGVTSSVYVKVLRGSVEFGDPSVSGVGAASGNAWSRYSTYQSGFSDFYIRAAEDNTAFLVDGAQCELGHKLTPFDDVNQDGSTGRSPSYLSYDSSGVLASGAGTVRFWYLPDYNTGDLDDLASAPYYGKRVLFGWCGSSPDPDDGWYIYYYEDGSDAAFYVATGDGGSTNSSKHIVNLTRGQAYHVVFSWSGGSGDLWIDGVKATDGSYDNTVHGPGSVHTKFYVGGVPSGTGVWQYAANNCANGMIDNLLLHSKQWSVEDIHADQYATSGTVASGLTITDVKYKMANKIPNSNFAQRSSLSGFNGWAVTVGSGMELTADYSKPKFSDVSIKIGV